LVSVAEAAIGWWQRALDLGVDVYLQKPVQFADINGTVRALLRLG
jgi:DNA-binding response OmpR family regulator